MHSRIVDVFALAARLYVRIVVRSAILFFLVPFPNGVEKITVDSASVSLASSKVLVHFLIR